MFCLEEIVVLRFDILIKVVDWEGVILFVLVLKIIYLMSIT
jgi:hypothetical protein